MVLFVSAMKLVIIEEKERDTFIKKVNDFFDSHQVKEIKFQRNLYYGLSGSTIAKENEVLEDGKKLIESYLAFILWE